MRKTITFYYKWIEAVSNSVGDAEVFVLTAKTKGTFTAKLETLSGEIFTQTFSAEAPLRFSATQCRCNAPNWAVLWIIGDSLADDIPPHKVRLEAQKTNHIEILDSVPEEIELKEMSSVEPTPCLEPVPGPEKIDAPATHQSLLGVSAVPFRAFKAFRNFLSS